MKLKDMMFVSLFTAIIGALAFFPPIVTPFTPVPITAQTLGVMLAGGILGARRGGLSLLLFICLLGIGVPLAAGGRGGLGVLFGLGGGYILAWPIAAWTIGYLTEKSLRHLKYWKLLLINIFGGIIIIYLGGVTYLSILSGTPWLSAALSALIFIPGDLVKVFIASAIILKLNQVYPVMDKLKQAA